MLNEKAHLIKGGLLFCLSIHSDKGKRRSTMAMK